MLGVVEGKVLMKNGTLTLIAVYVRDIDLLVIAQVSLPHNPLSQLYAC
jgi:hypothetical protein